MEDRFVSADLMMGEHLLAEVEVEKLDTEEGEPHEWLAKVVCREDMEIGTYPTLVEAQAAAKGFVSEIFRWGERNGRR